MSSILSAISAVCPSNHFTQDRILKFMIGAQELKQNEASRLEKLYALSGIEQRHSVLPDFGSEQGQYTFFGNDKGLVPYPTTSERGVVYEREAIGLGVKAVEQLQRQRPDLALNDITHLITVSCTGMYAPGLDIDLVERLGLSRSVERTCINFMGCYGAFNALKMADYICRAAADPKVLIVDIELCTLHFQKENTLENWLSNSLFGDGAAAMLVERYESNNSRRGFLLETFYNELFLEARDEMAWRIGDTGYEMCLSSRISKNIRRNIAHVTQMLLGKAGLAPEDISGFAVHPGGRRILEVCQEALESCSPCLKHSYDVLKQYGNMSSVTILFVLQRFIPEVKSGERIMSFAFGPGLTFESMILQAV